EKLTPDHVARTVGPTLSDSKISKVGYDIKSAIKACISLGIELKNIEHDVQIGAFLINPLIREQALTDLASEGLGYEGSSLDDMDKDELSNRAPEVVAVIHALYELQKLELKKLPKVAKLASDIEWPIIPVLAKMEYEGIQLDTSYLKEMSGRVEDMISD